MKFAHFSHAAEWRRCTRRSIRPRPSRGLESHDPHLAADPGFVARFEREAKSAARLSHPHVVAVYDQEADGLVYLAMELIPGRTLRDVIRDYGPLTTEQAPGLPRARRGGILLRRTQRDWCTGTLSPRTY